MVWTVLWLGLGFFFLPSFASSVFSEDSLLSGERMGLRKMTTSDLCHPSTSLARKNSFHSLTRIAQCSELSQRSTPSRFNFDLKRESFNLQHVRDMSSLLNNQGGSRLLQATYD